MVRQSNKLSYISLVVGAILVTGSLVFHAYSKTVLSFTTTPESIQVSSNQNHNPVLLKIPTKEISLKVEETKIQNGVWQIAEEGSHLSTSADPGAEGNIVIYAHNDSNKLGKLKDVSIGEKIIIVSADNTTHEYKVVKKFEVQPTNTEILRNGTNELLTLYTCTGFADLKRLIVQATPVTE